MVVVIIIVVVVIVVIVIIVVEVIVVVVIVVLVIVVVVIVVIIVVPCHSHCRRSIVIVRGSLDLTEKLLCLDPTSFCNNCNKFSIINLHNT